MYKEFDLCITDFSNDNEPGDYWYDCAVVESAKILSKFNEPDWVCLFNELAHKSIFWKTRLVECLGDLKNSHELNIILALIDTDNYDLFISCVDSLRSMDICDLSEDDLGKINDKIYHLKQNASLPVKSILESFSHKFKSK
ncbi:hypothetical protein [Proteus hauseri]|uniref:hypothetical protein n=1 Tax=Proteus hauseri TaxID=183417 RepID=UPI0032DABF48